VLLPCLLVDLLFLGPPFLSSRIAAPGPSRSLHGHVRLLSPSSTRKSTAELKTDPNSGCGPDTEDRYRARLTACAKFRELAGGAGHTGIITRWAEGVTAAAPDGAAYEGVLFERDRYPVGSGDAFLAGLVVGLDRDEPWPAALRLALGAAAANAALPGAGTLDASKVGDLAARADVREV
jgi:hypothetical protein